jgi:elongation factor G
VYAGKLQPDTQFYNLSKDQKERIGQIVCMLGKKQIPVEELNVGDIGAVVKLSETGTGDTLSQDKQGIVLPTVKIPKPIISLPLPPKNAGRR